MLISVVTNYSKIPQIVTIFITRSGYHPTCPTAASNFTRNTLVQYRGPVIPFHGQAEDQSRTIEEVYLNLNVLQYCLLSHLFQVLSTLFLS